MNDDTAIVVKEESVQLGTLLVAPEAVVQRATQIANVLADVIKEKKLSSRISGKDYVRVEGWSTLGAMLGVLPVEVEVKQIENGYEAKVELIRTSDGMKIGAASAICTNEEKNWSDRLPFAVRSMAITRATGKAYRLGFAWIMELAGYAGTPAEEMDFVEGKTRDVSDKPRVENQWEQPVLDKLLDLGLVNAKKHAVNTLEQSPFKSVPYGDLEIVEAVAYFIGRAKLKEEHPDIKSEERAAMMNKAWEEGNNGEYLDKAIEMLNVQE